MNNYKVYVHVNKHNGKKYFGITCRDVKVRWRRDGSGYKDSDHFWKAICKYGWDGFHHWVLFSGLDKETACKIEQQLIAEHMTMDGRFGYNLTSGGEHYTPSSEAIEKMRAAKVGWKPSEETRKKLSAAKKGVPKTEEHKRKISEAQSQPVECIETGRIYRGLNVAAKCIGRSPSCISCAIHGKQKTAGGYHWRFVGGENGTVR